MLLGRNANRKANPQGNRLAGLAAERAACNHKAGLSLPVPDAVTRASQEFNWS